MGTGRFDFSAHQPYVHERAVLDLQKAAVQLFSSGEIWNDLRVSGIEFAWGYFLSVIVGVPFGIAIGWYRKFAYVCDPFVNAMNATPRVALLPLVIIWLGIGILSKVGIIFLGGSLSAADQYPRWREDHAAQSSYRCPKSSWRLGMANFQKRCPSFDCAFYPYGLETGGRPGLDRCHGGRALCRHGGDRFYDHSSGGDFSDPIRFLSAS